MAADAIAPIGFATPFPAMSGADPWIGSNKPAPAPDDGARSVPAAWLTVIQPTGELPDDEHVHVAQAVRFEGRAVDQGSEPRDRAQVRVYAQQSTQPEQTGLGLQVPRRVLEARGANRAEQHRVGALNGGARLFRQWIAHGRHPGGTHGKMRQGERDPKTLARRLEHALRLGGHLRADAIPREHGDRITLHDPSPKRGTRNSERGTDVRPSVPRSTFRVPRSALV